MIHRTALVDPSAHLGQDVAIGPYTIVGPNVVLGDHCQLAAHVVVERNTRLGAGVKVGYGSVLGADPQDLKYKGEDTWVEIGDGTILREYCTINRGTPATGKTTVGARCFIMTYVHIAHDCAIGSDVILANAIQMAGHVTIDDRAIVSGLVPIHQFVRIGTYAFVDGLNSVGLQRAAFSADVKLALKKAYRLVFNSHLTVSQGIGRARAELPAVAEVETFLRFIEASQRGVLV